MPPIHIDTLASIHGRVDTSQASSIRYWTRTLGVTTHELCLVVASVGDLPADVKAEIRRRRRLFSAKRL